MTPECKEVRAQVCQTGSQRLVMAIRLLSWRVCTGRARFIAELDASNLGTQKFTGLLQQNEQSICSPLCLNIRSTHCCFGLFAVFVRILDGQMLHATSL